MAKISVTGYHGVSPGYTKKDGTRRFVAFCAGSYLGSFSTAFEAARAYDFFATRLLENPVINFPPLKFGRRLAPPGMTLREMWISSTRAKMLAPSRFEHERELRYAYWERM